MASQELKETLTSRKRGRQDVKEAVESQVQAQLDIDKIKVGVATISVSQLELAPPNFRV